MEGNLGRRIPTDWKHVEKYPFSALAEPAPVKVEKILSTSKSWRIFYNQGSEGACVGFGSSHMMSILNRYRYDARWLWNEAKKIDEWTDTNPGDNNGTSVRAGMEILRTLGHVVSKAGKSLPVNAAHGIAVYRWTGQNVVDEIRTAISLKIPVVIGINWYRNFDKPQEEFHGLVKEYWIGEGELGNIRGGHCVCIYGVSDRRQAFKIVNSWGLNYPQVWMDYKLMERLIKNEAGEAALVTDK